LPLFNIRCAISQECSGGPLPGKRVPPCPTGWVRNHSRCESTISRREAPDLHEQSPKKERRREGRVALHPQPVCIGSKNAVVITGSAGAPGPHGLGAGHFCVRSRATSADQNGIARCKRPSGCRQARPKTAEAFSKVRFAPGAVISPKPASVSAFRWKTVRPRSQNQTRHD
jgi:hypothetical protein